MVLIAHGGVAEGAHPAPPIQVKLWQHPRDGGRLIHAGELFVPGMSVRGYYTAGKWRLPTEERCKACAPLEQQPCKAEHPVC